MGSSRSKIIVHALSWAWAIRRYALLTKLLLAWGRLGSHRAHNRTNKGTSMTLMQLALTGLFPVSVPVSCKYLIALVKVYCHLHLRTAPVPASSLPKPPKTLWHQHSLLLIERSPRKSPTKRFLLKRYLRLPHLLSAFCSFVRLYLQLQAAANLVTCRRLAPPLTPPPPPPLALVLAHTTPTSHRGFSPTACAASLLVRLHFKSRRLGTQRTEPQVTSTDRWRLCP
jgi:hypothetical protein